MELKIDHTEKFRVNNIDYIIEDNSFIKVQSSIEDVEIYGWALESRIPKYQTDWSTHYGNHLYQSRQSALDAYIKINDPTNSYNTSFYWEFRVVPLYKLSEPEYRDMKINKILDTNKKEYEIKGWKVKEDLNDAHVRYGKSTHFKKGSLFIQLENGSIIKPGISFKGYYINRKFIDEMIDKELVEEVNITDEKWSHPHLIKELKAKFKITK